MIARVGIEGETYRNIHGSAGFSEGWNAGSVRANDQYSSVGGQLGMLANDQKVSTNNSVNPYTSLRFDPETMCVYGCDAGSTNQWKQLRNLTSDYGLTDSGLLTLSKEDFASGFTMEISVELMNGAWNTGRNALYNANGGSMSLAYTAQANGDILATGYDRFARIDLFALGDDSVSSTYCADANGNGLCDDDACGKIMDGVAGVYGASLSLNGNIGLNYILGLSESVLENPSAYMEVCYNEKTITVPVSEAEEVVLSGKTYYRLTAEVSAKDADKILTMKIVNGEEQSAEYKYSIRAYAESILADTTDEYAQEKTLVRALLTYTDFAKAYFDENATPPIVSAKMQAVTASSLQEKALKVTDNDENIEVLGCSLLLKSETSLRVYFRAKEGVQTIAEAVAVQDDIYYVEIKNIVSSALDKTHTIVLDGVTVECSALSYVYSVLSSDDAPESLQNLVKALRVYNATADTYFAQN